jgi:hypothetical protein
MKEFWKKFNIKISEKDFTVLGLFWAMIWRFYAILFVVYIILRFLEALFS